MPLTPKEMIRLLLQNGFVYVKSNNGSHQKYLVDCKCKLNKIYQATISVEYTLSRKVSNSSSGL